MNHINSTRRHSRLPPTLRPAPPARSAIPTPKGALAEPWYPQDLDLPREGPLALGAPGIRAFRVPRVVVVLGRGSDPRRELHLDACMHDRVPLLRRGGGGCAVLLDRGNLVVEIRVDLASLGETAASARLRALRPLRAAAAGWLLEALRASGIPDVRILGPSDIVQGDRKIGGTCIHVAGGGFCYSATLLIAPRLELVERYLRHPPREPDYRRGRAHRDFMGACGKAMGTADPDRALARLAEGARARPFLWEAALPCPSWAEPEPSTARDPGEPPPPSLAGSRGP